MKHFLTQFSEAAGWIADVASRFSARADTGPIDTADRLFEFARTRASLIAQKKLYGYLKERMGISYPKMFEDEVFANAIHIATMHIFAASLSDLTVHVVGNATAGSTLPAPERCRMAVESYKAGIEANAAMVTEPDAPDKWLADFEARIDDILWDNVAAGGNAFTESPKALIKWAPISDEYKKYDREIVENSIRYAWNEIREDFRKRLDAPAVVDDWTAADAA